MSQFDLVFFGIQGSGKGTQAKLLAGRHGFHIYEAGGSLREIASTETELGKKVRETIDGGNLVSAELILHVMEKAVTACPADQRILFDGIPRNQEQKDGFDAKMKQWGRPFACININVPREMALERILERGAQEGRADDQERQSIEKRFTWFEEQNIPVIEQYRQQGILVDADGVGTIEEVAERVEAALTELEQRMEGLPASESAS